MIAAAVLLLSGTGLLWLFVPAPDAAGVAALGLSAAGMLAAIRARTPRVGGILCAVLVAASVAVVWSAEGARAGAPRLGEALFSSREGLLFWNPAAWLGLAGLARLFRREPVRAAALGGSLFLAAVALGCLPAGPSGPFAARRFAPVLPLLAPGLAATLDAVMGAARRAPGAVLAAAGGLLVAWNLLFMELYRSGRVPRDATVSFVAVTQQNAALASRLFGSPVAWPANWVFAAVTGLPAERFDLLAGKRLAAGAHGARAIEVGDLTSDAALLLEGWSVRHPCAEGTCRDLEGRARLLAPLESPARYDLVVHASGEGVLVAEVNGAPAGEGGLAAEPALVRFPVREPWRRLNVIALAVRPGGRARVDRVVLEPRGSAS